MKNRLLYISLLIIVISSYFVVGKIVYESNQKELDAKKSEILSLKKLAKDNKIQINELINLNKEIEVQLDSARKTKTEIVSSFTLGNKTISTEELLVYVNSVVNTNEELQKKLNVKIHLLRMIQEKYGIDNSEDDKSVTISLNEKSTISDLYEKIKNLESEVSQLDFENKSNKKLLKMIQDNYQISGAYTENGDKVTYKVTPSAKIDSALKIYPFFKHKLFKDKKGEWRVKY